MKKLILSAVTVGLVFALFFEVKEELSSFQLREAKVSQEIIQLKNILTMEKEYTRRKNLVAEVAKKYNDAFPDSAIKVIIEMSYKYNGPLSTELICATITHESAKTWRRDIVSKAGAMGLMQIMPATGAFLAQEEGLYWTTAEEVLFNPINNIRMGCRYLSALVKCYGIEGGLAAYNGGERRARRYVASNFNPSVLYEETRGYIPAILQLHERYNRL